MAEPGRARTFSRDVVVVGGCGHVGLPLAIALASRGVSVTGLDLDAAAVAAVRAGGLPFREPGAELPLRQALAAGTLAVSTDPAVISSAEHVVVAVDGVIESALADCAEHLRSGQLLVLRATMPAGATARAEKLIADLGLEVTVAYCPERIAEGNALTELFELPQIAASRSQAGLERAARLFRLLTSVVVPMMPEEAELAKLFANAWRYVSFATANQLYAIANDRGLDYERIRQGISLNYQRGAQLPRAGFAAGPCLAKDTACLTQAHAGFSIGQEAIAANDGLPDYLVERLEQRYWLADMCVGILGMAFKAGSDDTRGSLSYRLKRLLIGRGATVLCTDPLVRADPDLVPLADVLARADLLIVATPQPEYQRLPVGTPVVDIWGVSGQGVRT